MMSLVNAARRCLLALATLFVVACEGGAGSSDSDGEGGGGSSEAAMACYEAAECSWFDGKDCNPDLTEDQLAEGDEINRDCFEMGFGGETERRACWADQCGVE